MRCSLLFPFFLLILPFSVLSQQEASSSIGQEFHVAKNIQDTWYEEGDLWLKNKVSSLEKTTQLINNDIRARNIILFVGDGMSITTLTAARILEGQQRGELGEENFLSFERYPHSALVKTYNSNQQTPDSAGSMSAMMTGVKTRAGVLSIGPEQERSECKGSKEHHRQTLLEWGSDNDFLTGVVTTTRLTHSTPAAAYAHSPERHWEGDWDRTLEAYWNGCDSIAKQLVQSAFPSGLDLAFGGGASHLEGYYSSFQQQFPNGALLQSSDELIKLTETKDGLQRGPVLGVFSSGHMSYEVDRQEIDAPIQPSLTSMAESAIKYLQDKGEKYILIVEGGRIDHAHHRGNAARALSETISFSNAIQRADEITDDQDTLIIVTADHSHTFMMAGYPKRGNPILSISKNQKNETVLANDNLPFTTLGYANGRTFGRQFSMNSKQDQVVDWKNTEDQNYRQGVAVKLSIETHGGDDVALHAKGPGAFLFSGQMEQHEIFHSIIQAALPIDSDKKLVKGDE